MYNGFLKKEHTNKKSAYLKGGIIGILACLTMMMLFSAVLLIFNIDRKYAAVFATISVAVGSYIASRITAKKIGDKGYVVGLVIGGVIFATITLISIIIGNSLSLNTFFHFIIITLSSLVGGITGVNKDKHKKYI